MTKTSIMLSSDNWALWESIPHSLKGRLVNHLMDKVRERLGDNPSRQQVREFLSELLPEKLVSR